MKKRSRSSITKKLDALASQRTRSRGKCDRCAATSTLQAAHVITRTNRQVRWDEANLMCLCAGCHLWWHREPFLAVAWFEAIWPQRYATVRAKANQVGKVDLDAWLEKLR